MGFILEAMESGKPHWPELTAPDEATLGKYLGVICSHFVSGYPESFADERKLADQIMAVIKAHREPVGEGGEMQIKDPYGFLRKIRALEDEMALEVKEDDLERRAKITQIFSHVDVPYLELPQL